jgi:toxin FitB
LRNQASGTTRGQEQAGVRMTIGYLVDTNVISELARSKANIGVAKFLSETPRLLVSTMLFHEINYGLASAASDQKMKLTAFVAAMRERFGARAIPVTLEIAETAGALRAHEKLSGRVLTVTDSIMAATAMVKGATLVTRNTKDFSELDMRLLNPFEL